MKKYLYLTSLLALTACFGGGSGTGGGTAPAPTANASVALFDGLISPEGVSSNHEITQMTSGVIVSNDGASYAVRSGHVTSGGHTYNVYDLGDVDFKIAENPSDYFNFKLATDGSGRIEQITEHLGGETAVINRIGETERFNGPIFELVKNSGSDEALYRVADTGQDFDDLAIPENLTTVCAGGCHWNRIDEVYGINTVAGKGATPDIALTYSDFGKFNPVYRSKHKNLDDDMLTAIRAQEADINALLDNNDTDGLAEYFAAHSELAPDGNHSYHTATQQEEEFADSKDFQLFAGGYAIKNGQMVDTLVPTNGMTFTGKAIGRIYTSVQTKGYSNRAELLSNYGYDKTQPIYSVVGGDPVYYYKGVQYTDLGSIPTGAGTPIDANDVGHDMAEVFTTTNENPATLIVTSDTGSATLTMPFENFYTVTTESTVNGDNVTYSTTFSDAAGVALDERYARDAQGDITETSEIGNFGYYGINTPSEAAGTIRVKDTAVLDGSTGNNPTAWREWEFQGAYGMTKDN